MQFLKILFWFLLAFVAALFTYGNWTSVQINLWGDLIADVNLPFLLLVTFLIGFLPTYLYLGTVRWRLRQRLASAERMLAESRAVAAPPTIAPVIASGVIAPSIVSDAAPPAVVVEPLPEGRLV